MLNAATVREYLNYDPETGVLTWKKKTGRKAKIGKAVGSVSPEGRRSVGFMGKRVWEHRLIWLWVYGCWPQKQIDHINGNACDNRLCNLRLSTQAQNMANTRLRSNNTSGYKGVFWDRDLEKWRASIRVNRKTYYLGVFVDKEDARRAYIAAATLSFGEFARP